MIEPGEQNLQQIHVNVCSETSYSGDERKCEVTDGGRTKIEARATQPIMDAGR